MGLTRAADEALSRLPLHEAFAAKTELTAQIILDVLAKSPPISVTMRERIDGLRAWARGRCVPAD